MVPHSSKTLSENLNIQKFTLQCKHYSKNFRNHTKLKFFYLKITHIFLIFFRINARTQIRLKPISSKIAHFSKQNYYNLQFTTTPSNHCFPTLPHTYFSSKVPTTFKFFEAFTNDNPDTCVSIIQNSTSHIATLPPGNIGYIVVPITNETPKQYQVHDIISSVHNVAQASHPEIAEVIPQTNYAPQYTDDTCHSRKIILHQVYVTEASTSKIQSNSLYNVQPSSHRTKPRIFPSIPNTNEIHKFIIKFNFQFSDLTDTDYVTLCNFFIEHNNCYGTHKNDVGTTSTPFPFRLKTNAQLMTQHPSKVPFHYRDDLNALLKKLEEHIIKQAGNSQSRRYI